MTENLRWQHAGLQSFWHSCHTDVLSAAHLYHRVWRHSPVFSSGSLHAKPKSMTFTFSGCCEWSTIIMLFGLRSAWTTPAFFRNSRAAASWNHEQYTLIWNTEAVTVCVYLAEQKSLFAIVGFYCFNIWLTFAVKEERYILMDDARWIVLDPTV